MKRIIPTLATLVLLESCDSPSSVPPLQPSSVHYTYDHFLRDRLHTYDQAQDSSLQDLSHEHFYVAFEHVDDVYSSSADVRPLGPLLVFSNKRLRSGAITLDGTPHPTKIVQGKITSYLYTSESFDFSSLAHGYHRLTVQALSEEGKQASDLMSILVR